MDERRISAVRQNESPRANEDDRRGADHGGEVWNAHAFPPRCCNDAIERPPSPRPRVRVSMGVGYNDLVDPLAWAAPRIAALARGRVLDVGCGDGHFLPPNGIGIDLDG